MKSILTAVAAAAILAVSAVGAQAATTFNLTGNSADSSSMAFSSGGIGMTAYSAREDSSVLSNAGKLTQTSGGLGVDLGRRDSDQVDSFGIDEAVIFVFDQVVALETVYLSSFGHFDEWAFFFDTDNNGSLDEVFLSNSANPYNFPTAYVGTTFGIGASGTGFNQEAFRIKGLAVSAVPLPAALPLYGAGLAVMGFVGWRKRRKAAAQA